MREVSQKARDLIADGDYAIEWVADLIYDDDPRVQNLGLLDPSFSWDMSAQVQGSGSCTILWDDVFGESIVPRDIGDLFSPFGAELQVDLMLSAGQFRERIAMGRFVLDAVPEGVEYAIRRAHGGLPLVAESRVRLSLADYFLRIGRDSFAFPSSPQSTSMWDEAQRLTGLPVFRSIPDRVLPTSITYEEDRLEALEKVFSPSNAWPALTSAGALTALPKEWGAPVARITDVISASLEMRSENVYNRVVVEGRNPDPNGKPWIAVAEVTDGFLRTRNADGSPSPVRGNTYRYSSDKFTSLAQCQAYADALLPTVARLRAVTRTVVVPFNPLFELGDVCVLVDPSRMGEESVVRMRGISHSGGETTLTVEVSE